MTCRICELEEVAHHQPASFDICAMCAARLGVMPMPPPRRPARPCDRCNGMRFTRVIPRELTAESGDFAVAHAAPMSLTIIPMTHDKMLGGKRLDSPDPRQGRGVVETYVCVGCGFVEWYCLDPQSIPIGPEYMAEVIDYGSDTPYR